MACKINIGDTFNHLTVISRAWKQGKEYKVAVKCKCGNETDVFVNNLRREHTKSCGCLRKVIKHGQYGTRLYRIWAGMLQRCRNQYCVAYKHYGAKGINVCKQWVMFENFYTWAITNGYKNNLTIDRVRSSLSYCPKNCRWVPQKGQCQNRQKYAGKTSKYIGVYKRVWKTKVTWQAKASIGGKSICIGSFDTEKQAAIERDSFVKQHYEYPVLNF